MKNILNKVIAIILLLTLLTSVTACDALGLGNRGSSGTKEDPDAKYLGTSGALPDTPQVIDCVDTAGNIKNVILIIGDGMGEAQLDAGELAYGKEFSFRDEFAKYYSNTNSLNSSTGEATEITDSAASATAMATGYLTYNKYTGITTDFLKLTTILDAAKSIGKSVGMVTTDYLTGATPAGFTAHTSNRNLENEVIKSQSRSGVDLLVGQYYDKYEGYEKRIKEAYNYFDEYDRQKIISKRKQDSFLMCEIETEAENSVRLSELASMAIEYLSADKDGFVLVIEQAHIDKACHSKDFAGAVKAAESLNATVEAVMSFARQSGETAVIVTADHETCGLQVSGNADEYKSKYTTEGGSQISYNFSATYHTDTLVPVYTWGFTAHFERLTTFASAEKIKNCEIFHVVADLIKYE